MSIGFLRGERGAPRHPRSCARPAQLALAVLASVALLVGCASESTTPDPPRSTPPATPAPSPTPEPPTPDELRHERAVAWVDARSTRELVGSVLMLSVPGTDATFLHDTMASGGLGGFVIMGANVPGTPEELRALTDALTIDSALPPLIAIDEEGGVVKRLWWDDFAGADALRFGPPEDVETAFRGRAQLLTESGLNVNFGIVADVTADPYSFIYGRSLGDTPEAAATNVAAAVRGEHGTVASTLKHFPGHGAAPGDSHFGIPQTGMEIDEWRATESVPFAAGIDAGAELLMFGHLSYTQVSPLLASLAPEWYRIARDDLGFTGVTVTDDLAMLPASGLPEYQDAAVNIITALAAGVDLALTVTSFDIAQTNALVDRIVLAVDEGVLPQERLREAALQVTELRMKIAENAAETIPR